MDWDSFDDRHQWPIIDTDKYQHFYRDVFYRKRTPPTVESLCDFAAALKRLLLLGWHPEHNNYVSMDQHEGAVGPIIWSIESRKGSSTVDRNRDLKVLVQSKKVRPWSCVQRGCPVSFNCGPLCWPIYHSPRAC